MSEPLRVDSNSRVQPKAPGKRDCRLLDVFIGGDASRRSTQCVDTWHSYNVGALRAYPPSFRSSDRASSGQQSLPRVRSPVRKLSFTGQAQVFALSPDPTGRYRGIWTLRYRSTRLPQQQNKRTLASSDDAARHDLMVSHISCTTK